MNCSRSWYRSLASRSISLAITCLIFSSFLTSQSSKFLWIFKGFVLCSALFNFQGTSSQLVSCNFYIISHLEVFVKWTFCECFWTFVHSFIPLVRFPLSSLCDRCRVRQPIYYITLLSFCQVNKLWTRSGSFHLFFPDSLAFPCDSLSIISHLSLLVKWTFCEVFTPPLFTLLRFPATALLLYHLLPLLSSTSISQNKHPFCESRTNVKKGDCNSAIANPITPEIPYAACIFPW